jgi:hypothetical protein
VAAIAALDAHRVWADSLDNWTPQHLATTNILTGATYGNGTYLVVGYNGEVQTSPNLTTWTKRTSAPNMRFLALTFANGVFVGSGAQPLPGGTNPAATVQTSTDGVGWTATAQTGTSNIYNAATFLNDKFMALGDFSNIATSSDGFSWSGQGTSGTGAFTIYGAAYGNGVYVVALNGGTVWFGSNRPTTGLPMFVGGPNPLKNTGTNNDLQGIAFGNGVFVAVGLSGTVVTSADGSSWAVRSSGTTNSLFGIAFANGVFIAVGSSGTIITSPDGVAWTARASGTTNQLRGVAFANDRFVAVGADGTMTTSGTSTATTGIVGNISTRGLVQTGDDAMFAGVIIQAGAKKILVRAAGPSLGSFGVNNFLADPTLELRDSNAGLLASNNDWQTTQVGGVITGSQVSAIQDSGLAPTDPKEPALIATLSPGNYTAIVRGVNNSVGIGVVQVYGLP